MRKDIRILLLMFVVAIILTGCQIIENYMRYERPELFHPRTEIAKSTITQIDSAKVFIEHPSEALSVGQGTYTFRIFDKTIDSETSKPIVMVYPNTLGNGAQLTNKQGKWYDLTIDRSKLKGGETIEIVVTASGAKDLSTIEAMKQGSYVRRSFKVKKESDTSPFEADSVKCYSEKLRIQSEPVDGKSNNPSFLITYLGEIKAKKKLEDLLTIRTDPIDLIKKEKKNIEFISKDARVSLDQEQIKNINSFFVEVELNEAKGKDRKEKINKGELIGGRIKIKGFEPVTTQVNCWSKDTTEQEFGKTFSDHFITCDVNFTNTGKQNILIYGSSLKANVRYLAAKDDVKSHYGENAVKNPDILDVLQDNNGKPIDYLDFKEPRRPMSFSDIIAIFEYQQKGHPYQRAIDLLKSAGELATAVSVFISASDYAKGVAVFTGIFIPETEKNLLWDVALHLKNLQARSLKEIEEVSANGQLHRVVFFPRGPIYCIVPQMPVYIAEIRPDAATADATIIDKVATVSTTPAK